MNNISNHRVLVVDDQPFDGDLIARFLVGKGYQVVVMQDARQVMTAIKDGNFDVVLLDIMMPEISGIELLKKIRESYSAFELPVLMLSASDEGEIIDEAFQSGASDYLTKPPSFKVALARIQTQIRLRRLYKESISRSALDAIAAMIATYNHEINNPLTIALGQLRLFRKRGEQDALDKMQVALDRIVEVVQIIANIEGSPEFREISKCMVDYDRVSSSKIIKIK